MLEEGWQSCGIDQIILGKWSSGWLGIQDVVEMQEDGVKEGKRQVKVRKSRAGKMVGEFVVSLPYILWEDLSILLFWIFYPLLSYQNMNISKNCQNNLCCTNCNLVSIGCCCPSRSILMFDLQLLYRHIKAVVAWIHSGR